MFFNIIFGIGLVTTIIAILLSATWIWDFTRNPRAYKENIDRRPWLW